MKKLKNKQTKSIRQTDSGKKPVIQHYLPYLGLAAILILVILIRRNFLSIPFERDEGFYSYCGQLLLDGKTPYIDFSAMHFPGLFYVYAGILGIFGNTLEQIHTGFICINIITIVLIFFIGRSIFSNMIGFIIAASFALLSMTPHASGFTVQAEHIIIMFMCGGLLVLIHAINSNTAISFFISGAMIGFSFLIKHSAIFFILFGGLAVLSYYWISKPQNIKLGIKNTLIFSGGVLVIFAAMMSLMIYYRVLDDMFYYLFVVAGNYVSEISLFQGIELLKFITSNIMGWFKVLWMLALAGLVFVFFLKISKYYKFFLLTLFLLSSLTVFPGFRFFGHYWIQTFPVVAIFIGVSIMFLIQFLSNILKPISSQILVLIAFIIIIIMNLYGNKKYYFNPDHTTILRNVYNVNPFPEAKVIGDFIKNNTIEKDKIIVIGSEPQLYIYTGRRCASRYHYFATLMSDTIAFPDIKYKQKEFIDDILREKPKYMVIFRSQISLQATSNSSWWVMNKFDEIAHSDYNLVGYVDMITDVNTQYVWYDDLDQYEPKGKYSIIVWERKV